MCFGNPLFRLVGTAAVSFGAGVVLTLILPFGALVVIEAALLVGTGVFFFLRP